MTADPIQLCQLLRERYSGDEPLTDSDRETLTSIHQYLALTQRLLVQRTTQIISPMAAVGAMLPEMSALDQEEMRVLLLDTKHHVIDTVTLYRGTLNTCVTRIAEIFRPAIIAGAESILVIHNHPSGDPTPSPEDILLTRRLNQAGNLLDIKVIDHIIIATGHFLSLKERGFFEGTFALPPAGEEP